MTPQEMEAGRTLFSLVRGLAPLPDEELREVITRSRMLRNKLYDDLHLEPSQDSAPADGRPIAPPPPAVVPDRAPKRSAPRKPVPRHSSVERLQEAHQAEDAPRCSLPDPMALPFLADDLDDAPRCSLPADPKGLPFLLVHSNVASHCPKLSARRKPARRSFEPEVELFQEAREEDAPRYPRRDRTLTPKAMALVSEREERKSAKHTHSCSAVRKGKIDARAEELLYMHTVAGTKSNDSSIPDFELPVERVTHEIRRSGESKSKKRPTIDSPTRDARHGETHRERESKKRRIVDSPTHDARHDETHCERQSNERQTVDSPTPADAKYGEARMIAPHAMPDTARHSVRERARKGEPLIAPHTMSDAVRHIARESARKGEPLVEPHAMLGTTSHIASERARKGQLLIVATHTHDAKEVPPEVRASPIKKTRTIDPSEDLHKHVHMDLDSSRDGSRCNRRTRSASPPSKDKF